MEETVVDGNGTETGHIIVTTIGGRNGQPKQVFLFCLEMLLLWVSQYKFFILFIHFLSKYHQMPFSSHINTICLKFQTISYMAERVVGQGSFGIVFQVMFWLQLLNHKCKGLLFWCLYFKLANEVLQSYVCMYDVAGEVSRKWRNCSNQESFTGQEI